MKLKFFLSWFQLVTNLAAAVMTAQGKDDRAARYLLSAVKVGTAVASSIDDLDALHAKYREEVDNDVPTSSSELEALEQRILERSAAIQSA